MGSIFFTSDTHWGSSCYTKFKCIKCKFRPSCGRPLCPDDFKGYKGIHEYFIDCWNSMVNEKDTIYHLGNVANHYTFLPLLEKCKGIKHLILGNHDTYFRQYSKYFNKIRGSFVLEGEYFLSHVPIAPEAFTYYRSTVNIHGHIHSQKQLPKSFTLDVKKEKKTFHYVDVIAANHDFLPVAFDRIKERIGSHISGEF